jgi:hypothetical protein
VATGTPVDKKKGNEEILEVVKAQEAMKPILIYFHKPEDPFAGDGKKDKESEACKGLHEDVWKMWIITELAREFVCVRVDKSKADAKLLRKHRVMRAPALKIVDFNLDQIFFTASPKVKYKSFAKSMDQARKKVEKAVKKLAGQDGTSPMVERAKARAQALEQRAIYDKGLTALQRRNWSGAAKEFNKGLAVETESEWKKACEVGLKEIEAGKLYVQAEMQERSKQYDACWETLKKIVNDYREAVYFGEMAKTLSTKIARKVKDK